MKNKLASSHALSTTFGFTSTSSPEKTSAAEMAAAFTKLFTTTNNTATKAALVQQFLKIGISSTSVESFVDSLQSFATGLSPNPSYQQLANFSAILNHTIDASIVVIETLPGLANLTTDPKFQNIPSTKILLQEIEESKYKLNLLNPSLAYDLYVKNAATTFSEFFDGSKMLKSLSDSVIATNTSKICIFF
jgi:hypothetical protein